MGNWQDTTQKARAPDDETRLKMNESSCYYTIEK